MTDDIRASIARSDATIAHAEETLAALRTPHYPEFALDQPLDAWSGLGPMQRSVICRCGRRSRFHYTRFDAFLDQYEHERTAHGLPHDTDRRDARLAEMSTATLHPYAP